MHVISPRKLREFWQAKPAHADAQVPLKRWQALVEAAHWQTFADAKQLFGHNVDEFSLPGRRPNATVFNAGSNKYRIATLVLYHPVNRVYIKRVMTHDEYDAKLWHYDYQEADEKESKR